MAGSTNASLTSEEVDFLTESVLSEKIVNNGEVNRLDQIGASPVIDYMMGRSKEMGAPTNDGYKFLVQGRNDQRIQWWDGADLLTFENKHNLSSMVFSVGRGHMGCELLYQFIEKHGIKVDYRKGIRKGSAAPEKSLEVVLNVIRNHFDQVHSDWKLDFARRFWRSNTDAAKCFAGVDALFPATGNTTGDIGGRSRSNPMFRHQLVTGITKTNFMLSFHELVKRTRDYQRKGDVEIFAVGDNVWQVLIDLFSGTDTVAGKFDYRSTREMAMKKGEKYNVALPQDCFMYEDKVFYREKMFHLELDVEEPSAAVAWADRLYGFNPEHFGIVPVMDMVEVNHGMPYNQRLERSSMHGEYVEWCNHPRSTMVGVLV